MAEATGSETRAEYLARVNATKFDGTPVSDIPQAKPELAKVPDKCPITGGDHQFKAIRSKGRRAAKVGLFIAVAPAAALLGGKNMGQCSACGKKVKW